MPSFRISTVPNGEFLSDYDNDDNNDNDNDDNINGRDKKTTKKTPIT